MAIDFDKLKKNISTATNSFVKSAQENLPESMKDINVKESLIDMASKGSQAVAKFTKQSADTDKTVKKALAEKSEELLINYVDAMRIIYCLISIDRVVSEKETEKYQEIGKQIDPLFGTYKDRIVGECQKEFEKADDDEYYDVVHDYVGQIIRNSNVKNDKAISGKALYWNLLATAYTEDGYSENEKRLIKYIARLFDIDKTITIEMESAIKTLLSIDEEKQFLQESGRTYKEVQVHMKDLEEREEAISQGVFALISD